MRWLLVTLGVLFIPVLPAESADPLVVGVKSAPPFVITGGETGELSGFSIDLVNELARRLEPPRTVEFRLDPDLPAHLEAVRRGKVDLGIAATTITAEREQVLDFSHPFYRSSLGILTASGGRGHGVTRILFSRAMGIVLLCLVLYLACCGVLVWFAERGSTSFDDRWFIGIAQGVWWTVVTMSTVGYGDFVPRRVFGRVLGVMVIFSGIALFGWAVAFFASSLTLERLESSISGPGDLAGKRVAAVSGTLGAEWVRKAGVKAVPVETMEEALLLVDERKVAAIVHDAPVLKYYAKASGGEQYALAPAEFKPGDYGIALPPGSRLREKVNVALLALMEGDGAVYERLNEKWFGQ